MMLMAERRKKAYKNTGVNIIRIFRVLKSSAEDGEGFLTVSEIARRANVHKWTVSRTLDLYMHSLVDVVQPQELEALGMQVKLVRLKNPDMTAEQVVNYLKMRSKIDS